MPPASRGHLLRREAADPPRCARCPSAPEPSVLLDRQGVDQARHQLIGDTLTLLSRAEGALHLLAARDVSDCQQSQTQARNADGGGRDLHVDSAAVPSLQGEFRTRGVRAVRQARQEVHNTCRLVLRDDPDTQQASPDDVLPFESEHLLGRPVHARDDAVLADQKTCIGGPLEQGRHAVNRLRDALRRSRRRPVGAAT